MNKKISTLLAGAALLSVVTVNAAPGDLVNSLTLGKNAGLYQLAIGSNGNAEVLAINASGELVMVTAPSTSAGLANTLWCVEVAKQEQGQAPKFDFVNKAVDLRLDVTMEDYSATAPVLVGGEVAGWAFSKTYAANLEANKPLYSFFTKDSVVGLVVDGITKMVTLKKALATDAEIAAAGYTPFTLKTSDEITLEAQDLNTMFGAQAADKGVKLKFNPDTLGTSLENPFSAQSFIAVAGTTPDYLAVKRGDNFLRVDTSFTNDKGARFLAYKWSNAADMAAYPIAGSYNFKFTYSPSNDSLAIQVETAKFDNGRVKTNAFVSLQDLIKNEARILTVDTLAQNTLISLNFKGCNIASNRTSIASDLYVIKNAAGKYLSVPLYGDSAVQWVTLDKNMDPWHMPAFQWVVEKTRTSSDDVKKASPIQITNREFGKVIASSLQLYTDGPSTLQGVSVNAANFVKDSINVKANAYVGYRFLDKDSMTVATYKLRYLHDFANGKYMGISNDAKDSVLYVGVKSSFKLKGLSEVGVNYGYTTSAISGLAQLVRKAYTLNLQSSDKMIVADAEDRYAVSASDKAAVFYLKENNHKEGSHYFALIDTASYSNDAPDFLRKVGVDDNNLYLKAQNMTETRTSAFSVEIDDAPLYRRFNNAALGESDKPDSLRFLETKRGEYLMDENNKKWQDSSVDYLGIWSKDKATGLSFRIDTAWVDRGLGFIKPQYLISVDRHEVAGVDTVKCTYPHNHYDNEGNKVDAANCSHATPGKPGYTVAKYLVSFQDSVDTVGKDLPYTDVKNGYTRVGFVKAIRQADTLYILANGFEKLAYDKLSVAAIVKSYKAAGLYDKFVRPLTNDTHKNYTWSFRYTNPEAAATVTKEGEANQFLIESMTYDDQAIAPEKAAWIKMQNGCIVLTDDKSEFNNAKTGGDGALVFNVENVENDKLATDNETITTSEVSVIATQGQVRIAGAEGKSVVISNILGQVIANTVLTSDDATIAVPAGIVVVAVEGEAAVKAIVK